MAIIKSNCILCHNHRDCITTKDGHVCKECISDGKYDEWKDSQEINKKRLDINEVLLKIVKDGKKLSDLTNEELAELYESQEENRVSVKISMAIDTEIANRIIKD